MRIRVTFSEMPDRFALGLNEQESFALKFDEGMLSHCVPYEGSYDIRPGLLAQTLPTNDRHLHEDIMKTLVEAIIVWDDRIEVRFKCGATVEQKYVA